MIPRVWFLLLSEAMGNFSEQLHGGLKDKRYLGYEKRPTGSKQRRKEMGMWSSKVYSGAHK